MRGLLGVLALAGCYSPSPKEGAPCSVTSECPAPLVCTGGACVRDGAPAPDAAPTGDCTCESSMLVCPTSTTPCVLGCSTMGGAHCVILTPSNGVEPTTAQVLSMVIAITGTTTFNTDTGRITGALSRNAGTGVLNGIGYEQRNVGATPLGVFSFHALDVTAMGKVQFAGARSAVFMIARDVVVSGEIDLSGCTAGTCAGPGGGAGTLHTATGGGCGGGTGGDTSLGNNADSGGGGGAGGSNGADGGNDDENGTIFAGGVGGAACIAENLEPLVGGSGGAGGGPGVGLPPRGGAGGGALQITSLTRIEISGIIDASGGGGAGGGADPTGNNAGAGAGGGAGGGILLEAPSVVLDATSILAANGGGGGGGGGGTSAGQPGQKGTRSATPAAGGQRAGQNNNGNGGAGGAANSAAVAGESVINANAGGGGGGAGRIHIRAGTLTVSGTQSPAATTATL